MDEPKNLNERTQRVLDVMKEVGMNATQFSQAIGVQRAAISHIMLSRNNPSVDMIAKIVERFKMINPGWLLTGNGQMKLASVDAVDVIEENQTSDKVQSNPVVNPTKEWSLFDQEENIPTTISFTDEISSGEAVEVPQEINKIIEKEVVVYKERPVKTIDKLLIFYSDHTYETFIPEKK